MMTGRTSIAAAAFVTVACCAIAAADVSVDYTVDAGGNNPDGPAGLAANAVWSIDGNQLEIFVRNTSSSVPLGAQAADSLLVSLAFNLGGDVTIVSGDIAEISAGSTGLGAWDALGEGDSVADQWLWTNHFGGDLLGTYAQVISTSNGQGNGDSWSFAGQLNPNVGGPYGGIAASPALIDVPGSQPAISDTARFSLTLSHVLNDTQLAAIANSSVIEYGSDFQYLSVPSPAVLPAMVLGLFVRRRSRR
jgi:hypothetical protein